jgi:hypothetical protein
MPQAPQAPQAPGVAAPSLEGIDPDVLRRFADQAGLEDEEAAIYLAQLRAKMLAGTETPQGRQTGDVYTAANPLEFIGSGMKQYAGMKGMKENEEAMRKLGKRRSDDAYAAYEMYGGPPLSL